MLYDFRDRLVLEYKQWWFVWEESWESFRPINGIAWDGTTFRINDREYCSNPFDPLYGYGSERMKELCDVLGDIRVDEPPVEVDTLLTAPASMEWFYDRRGALTPCAPRTRESWKRMVRSHPRTCRKAPKGRAFTRRQRRSPRGYI